LTTLRPDSPHGTSGGGIAGRRRSLSGSGMRTLAWASVPDDPCGDRVAWWQLLRIQTGRRSLAPWPLP
jgi:hypothetical protein